MKKEMRSSILSRRWMAFVLVFVLMSGVFSMPVKVYANPYPGGDGNCTYAAWRLAYENTGIQLPAWSNACTWYDSARSAGYVVSTVPREKSIAVWSGGSEGNGHVAYVSQVSGNQIYIHEGGYYGGYHEGWENAYGQTKYYSNNLLTMIGYIYLGDVVSANNPQGNIDAVEGGAGCIRVSGWGFDKDNLSATIEIHVYIGGSAAEPDRAEGHVIYANKGRGDVHQALSCGEYHGFEETISTKKTGEQVVWLYAINIGGGENTCLGSRTVNILPSPSPEGVLESVEGGAGFVQVGGWSFDRDNLSAALKIYVYIGGDASSGAEMHVIQADKGRGDVHQALSCGEYHGFTDIIFTDKTGTQKVYVYAINVGDGDNVCLGSATVNISPVSLGDVFQDGKVDGKDVSILQQYCLKKKNLTAEQLAAGDVYKDGKIDGKDVSKLLQYRLGKITSLK